MKLDIEAAQAFEINDDWWRLPRQWMLECIADDAQEHYRLLGYLASQVRLGRTIIDMGTSTGFSAWAMAMGSRGREIISYDTDWSELEVDLTGLPVTLRLESAELADNWRECDLALLDICHDGGVEQKVINNAIEQEFRGVMVMDDIRGCAPLNNIFRNMPLRRYDLSRFFHWSGTGILDFSNNLVVTSGGKRLIPLGMK